MLKDNQDAFGHEMFDYFTSKTGWEIIERDDGYYDASIGPKIYFSEYEDWPPIEKKAMRYARGRVLDIGSGAGRHCLYLQDKGHDVLATDNSPLAIEVCKLRGLRNASITSINQINSKSGVFDTILMLGNNFGLFGSFERARRLLQRFHKITTQNARIIANSYTPYQTDIPEHLQYHKFNRERGRMAGQLRVRVRYKKYVTPWFDYLIVSKEEMENILVGTGWRVTKYLESDNSYYIAIIEKNT